MTAAGRVAGVDAHRRGWAVAEASTDRHDRLTLTGCSTFDEVLTLARDRGWLVVAVDMPIGLPRTGRRPSDALARARLGRRASSLFTTPAASAVEARSYEAANRSNRASMGIGLSKQSYNLFPRIREVRSALGGWDGCPVYEAHPETSFAAMTDEPLPPKRTPEGASRRVELLGRFLGDPRAALAAGPGDLTEIDALDAMAAAWTARRIVHDEAVVLGDPSARDAEGFELTIRV